MKKITLLFCLALFASFARAQSGLECVEVEVYYISDANDSIGNDFISLAPGTLPAGSVTYRVYANLLQGYNFQAVYGVPGHELRLETTTMFFNNEDRGTTSPTYTKTQARANTVMLDSWFSVGAGCASNFGILKSEDDGVATVLNITTTPGRLLQNTASAIAILLTTQNGLIATAAIPLSVTFVGFSGPELNVFDNTTNGNLLSTTNASWAALGGSKGPDTVINRVLIGQFTTKGIFSFKLNIQVGTPSGGVQNFVAENPVGNEVQLPCLILKSGSIWTDVHEQNSSSPSSMISVYPNPAEDFVMVAMNNSTRPYLQRSLRIYDMAGKMVLNKNVAADEEKRKERIDISSLKSGIYFIETIVDGMISHQKFVKN